MGTQQFVNQAGVKLTPQQVALKRQHHIQQQQLKRQQADHIKQQQQQVKRFEIQHLNQGQINQGAGTAAGAVNIPKQDTVQQAAVQQKQQMANQQQAQAAAILQKKTPQTLTQQQIQQILSKQQLSHLTPQQQLQLRQQIQQQQQQQQMLQKLALQKQHQQQHGVGNVTTMQSAQAGQPVARPSSVPKPMTPQVPQAQFRKKGAVLSFLQVYIRPGLLEACLVLTGVKYHGNLYILIPLNQRLALTMRKPGFEQPAPGCFFL